jgi:hypothetical protein
MAHGQLLKEEGAASSRTTTAGSSRWRSIWLVRFRIAPTKSCPWPVNERTSMGSTS